MTERQLTVGDLQVWLAERRPMILLDVRNAKDHAAEPRRIPGALKLDAEMIGAWVGMLPPESEVVAYCQHGQRLSNLVVDALQVRSIKARNLAGGMDAWLAAGGVLTAP